jgi:hypothetical protein|tara:strand:+ start:261 stop:596 length:336 start_codon:yes stop_codon:yes gene_type:complete
MARWTVTPGTENNTMKGTIDYSNDGNSEWQIYQDEKPFLERAKADRDFNDSGFNKKDLGFKKFATVPDIVAIEIKNKWGIDLHDSATMKDKDKMAKFMAIFKQNYSHLMSY